MYIPTNNGGELEVSLQRLTSVYLPPSESTQPVQLKLGGIVLNEGEIVALYNFVNKLYENKLTVEEFLVYSLWDEEIVNIRHGKERYEKEKNL